MQPDILYPERFTKTDLTGIATHLETHGYVVVRELADPHELTRLFRRDLETISPRAIGIGLWDLMPDVHFPGPAMPGLLGEWGLSQGNACWTVRTNRAIQQIFQSILGVDGDHDLVVSMDAVGFSSDREEVRGDTWLHVDYNPLIKSPLPDGIDSYQGILYATDVTEGSACTVVVPGSHLHYKEHTYDSSTHFQIVNPNLMSDAVKLMLRAGDLLVFNSKTVHQGWHGPHRLCFMVSYGRKQDRTNQERAKKLLMYMCGQRGNHWSQLGQLHGDKEYISRVSLMAWLSSTIINTLKPQTVNASGDSQLDAFLDMTSAKLHDVLSNGDTTELEQVAEELSKHIPAAILDLL